MSDFKLIRELSQPSPSKIVLLVMDGLGGLPHPDTGKSELETAQTPNLDRLAAKSICGLSDPVAPGITPGSAPGHLGLFGYDPVICNIGRGVLEAVGIDLELQNGDIAARGNFCSVDGEGRVTDRRAGRISTDTCTELCRLLDGMNIEDIQVFVYPVREHRFVAVFRGKGLDAAVTETDPQKTGVVPLTVNALTQESRMMADVANRFISEAGRRLEKSHPANMVLLRGFSGLPDLPSMQDIYKLKPLAISVYPMYRGLARLVGMEIVDAGTTIKEEFAALRRHYSNHDFFFIHVKWTDSAGEDGDFERKVRVLEEVDAALPDIESLNPDVIVITGDHSTPALLKGHSWHPVPVMIHSKYCRTDGVNRFSEADFLSGGLGRIKASQIMPLAMANALKLAKFGA